MHRKAYALSPFPRTVPRLCNERIVLTGYAWRGNIGTALFHTTLFQV